MSSQHIFHVTEKGTEVLYINSLEELADCSLKDIEIHPSVPHGGKPRTIVFEWSPNDIYRIGDMCYKALKHEYLESAGRNSKVDDLIKTIDARLKPQIKP